MTHPHAAYVEKRDEIIQELARAVTTLDTPPYITLDDLKRVATPTLLAYLNGQAARVQLGKRLTQVGYRKCGNPEESKGRHRIEGRRLVVYKLGG